MPAVSPRLSPVIALTRLVIFGAALWLIIIGWIYVVLRSTATLEGTHRFLGMNIDGVSLALAWIAAVGAGVCAGVASAFRRPSSAVARMLTETANHPPPPDEMRNAPGCSILRSHLSHVAVAHSGLPGVRIWRTACRKRRDHRCGLGDWPRRQRPQTTTADCDRGGKACASRHMVATARLQTGAGNALGTNRCSLGFGVLVLAGGVDCESNPGRDLVVGVVLGQSAWTALKHTAAGRRGPPIAGWGALAFFARLSSTCLTELSLAWLSASGVASERRRSSVQPACCRRRTGRRDHHRRRRRLRRGIQAVPCPLRCQRTSFIYQALRTAEGRMDRARRRVGRDPCEPQLLLTGASSHPARVGAVRIGRPALSRRTAGRLRSDARRRSRCRCRGRDRWRR
jgi:hypothetical protein